MALEIKLLDLGDIELESSFLVQARDCGSNARVPTFGYLILGDDPILIDSGFRRGTDFFKALALGADAVCIGRPYLWGLASFGQEGVEAVLDILRSELEIVMKGLGTPNLASITPAYVRRKCSACGQSG